MVTVSISETYDLHTVVDKMTLIGIHTPRKELIMKMYPGLCMNFKHFRILGQNVVLSTAQQLPLSVQDVGLDVGQVHPQDIMNPILYKAMSNDSWSTLEARLQGIYQENGYVPDNPVSGSMATVENDNVTGLNDEKGVYYSLLSNRDGWRVASLQAGVEMRNLVPLVFEKLYTHSVMGPYLKESPQSGNTEDTAPGIQYFSPLGGSAGYDVAPIQAWSVRGRPKPMPKMNTTYITGADPALDPSVQTWQWNGMGDALPKNFQSQS